MSVRMTVDGISYKGYEGIRDRGMGIGSRLNRDIGYTNIAEDW